MHQPRKRFGQHFLRDPQIIAQLVAAIAPQAGEPLVEIGPGQGALTLPLLTAGAVLEVIEIDRDLAKSLREQYAQLPLQVHLADALQFDFASLAHPPLRIVGNLPYNISTPLLFHLLTFCPLIKDMHFMLQTEVAQRIAAPPRHKNYGRLSVMLQYYCEVVLLFDVPPTAFYPPPQVNSTVLRLIPHASPLVVSDPIFFATLVKQAFAQRRKTLRNTLKSIANDTVIKAAGIDPQARAEELSVADFVTLSETITIAKNLSSRGRP